MRNINKFRVGDVVANINKVTTNMTVEGIADFNNLGYEQSELRNLGIKHGDVYCVWFDEDINIQRGAFNPKELVLLREDVRGGRHMGNTTRQIDSLIQQLFDYGFCEITDFTENSFTTKYLIDKTLKRLELEHPLIKISYS